MSESQQQPFLGALAPIAINMAAKAVVGAAIKKAAERSAKKDSVPLQPSVAANVAEDIVNELTKDPVAVNAMNMEPVTQSRVVQGAAGATLLGTVTAVAIIWDQIQRRDFNPTILGPAIATVLGASWALYGRLRKRLKPA